MYLMLNVCDYFPHLNRNQKRVQTNRQRQRSIHVKRKKRLSYSWILLFIKTKKESEQVLNNGIYLFGHFFSIWKKIKQNVKTVIFLFFSGGIYFNIHHCNLFWMISTSSSYLITVVVDMYK